MERGRLLMRLVFRITVLALGVFLIASVLSVCAQNPAGLPAPMSPNPSSVDCTAPDLDTTYQFTNEPPTERVILTFRNISNHPCMLHSGEGVMFNDYRHGHNIWTKDCRNCRTTTKNIGPIELQVGGSAQMIVTWQTLGAPGGEPCQQGGAMNGNAWDIWAVSLLGDVCSVVYVDSYLPQDIDQQEKGFQSKSALEGEPISIALAASGDTAYSLDSFWLHVNIVDRAGTLGLNKNSCPLLFLRTRGSDGSTSLQEISGQCHISPLAESSGKAIRLDLSTMGWGALGAPVDHSVQLFAVLGSAQAPRVTMVGSNIVNIRTLDPATIPRTWGPESLGLAISLFLDKDTYRLGEDIPLRMALENFSADVNIASGELPCSAGLSYEVVDSNGQKQNSTSMECTGHGWIIGYPKGKVVPVTGVTLRSLGLLPDRPGTYFVAATWNAQSEKKGQPDSAAKSHSLFGAVLEPYTIVHSAPIQFVIRSQ